MLLIGLVLLAAASAVGIDVAAQNHFDLSIDAFGQTYATSPAAVLVTGVVVGIATAIGLMLMVDGVRRARRRRIARRETVAERDRLARAYEDEHPDHEIRESARDEDTVDIRDRLREHVNT